MKTKHLRSSGEEIRHQEVDYPIYIPIPESEFLRKVAQIETRQLDHFVRNKLLSNEKSCRGCSKPGCAHSLNKLPHASRSRSPEPALTYQHSSPNFYHEVQERFNEKMEQQRESLAKKMWLKSLYIDKLEKNKQDQREESKKKRNEKFKINQKNRESKERQKRKKNEEVVKRIRWKDQKMRSYQEKKALELKEAFNIRKEVERKKEQLGQRIIALQDKGFDNCSILSVLSIQSFSAQKQAYKSSSTGFLSTRNPNKISQNLLLSTQRDNEKASASQYFIASSKSKKKTVQSHKTLAKTNKRSTA